jgi:hypothetical protein
MGDQLTIKVGDLVRHIHYGVGIIYKIEPEIGEGCKHYWRAAMTYETEKLCKCLWAEHIYSRHHWVATFHLEIISEC